MKKDEREFTAREMTQADELVCNNLGVVAALVFDQLPPPALAVTVMAKLGLLVGAHDGTFTAVEELKKLMMATFEANYAHARQVAEGKLPQKKDLN